MRLEHVRSAAEGPQAKKRVGRGKNKEYEQERTHDKASKTDKYSAEGSGKGGRYVAPVPAEKLMAKKGHEREKTQAPSWNADSGGSSKKAFKKRYGHNRNHGFHAVPEEEVVEEDDVEADVDNDDESSEPTTCPGTSDTASTKSSDFTTPTRRTSDEDSLSSCPDISSEQKSTPRLVALPPRPFDQNAEVIRLGLYDPYDEGAERSLYELLDEVSGDHVYENRMQECAEALRVVCNDYFSTLRLKGEEVREVRFRAVGSYRQNTHLKASDYDLSLEVVTTEEGIVRSSGWCAHIISGLQDYVRNQHDSLFGVKLMLSTARVPVLKLDFYSEDGATLEVDLTVETDLSKRIRVLYRDDVVSQLIMFADPLANTLVRIVKHWAKTRLLNSAFEGTLNSLSWALLIVSYLQQQGLIPSFEELPNYQRLVYTDTRLTPQLRGFFRWMVDVVGSGPHIIDVMQGTCLPGPSTMQQPLCLKDPDGMAPDNANTAATLQPQPWLRILDECARSAQCLSFIRGNRPDDGWDPMYYDPYQAYPEYEDTGSSSLVRVS